MDQDRAVDICSNQCGAECCSGIIFLGEEDIKKLKQLGYSNFTTDNNKKELMLTDESNDCIFLDENNKCSIYENRPIDCQLFPLGFKINSRKIHIVLIKCPLSKELPDQMIDSMSTQAKKLISSYSEEELYQYDNLPFESSYTKISSFSMDEIV